MFGKNTKQNEQTEVKELTAVERELQRVEAERAKIDPVEKPEEYKKLTAIISLLQDENLKVKTVENKTIENDNKSNEGKEKKAERGNKVVTALIQGVLPVVGCTIIPIVEQHAPPMSKVFNPAIGNMFKHK